MPRPRKTQPEEAPAAAPAPIPNAPVPDDAARAAEAIAAKWGSTGLVRAAVAVLNQRTRFADSMDISEAHRVIAIRRRTEA